MYGKLILIGSLMLIISGCAGPRVTKTMNTTAYCNCGKCCSWERGSWTYLKLDFWNRYVSRGNRRGQEYNGLTAAGTDPVEPVPGLFSMDSLEHPWMIPFR
ncbi:MAG: hypothetical protein OEV64_13415, partial [Desulfobulbaceae bacterium]|nr:hypothetical protein [Desulfobulbaceae bacterium]